ncbi:hypothetical protein ABK040_009613 [Willaertia magna]
MINSDDEDLITPGTANSEFIFEEDEENYVFEDDGGEDGFQNEDDFRQEVVSREKDYEILSVDEIVKEQEKEIARIVEILGVTDASAKVLLRRFGWKAEKIMNTFFDKGREGVLKDVGLSENDIQDASAFQVDGDSVECPLCYDDVPANECTKLPACGHYFCNNCWKYHIEQKIKEGQQKIPCPQVDCNYVADESIVSKFVSGKEKAKYDQKFIDSYVEDNQSVKWCPSTPNCGRCARVNVPYTTPLEIECTCTKSFCFNCLEEPHLPATCNMLKSWKKKCQDDSETANWLSANTKDCPKCGTPIEKNGGCNHMHCTKCDYHFCWICSNFFDHKTYQHSCGRYEEKDNQSARQSLERYLHYYNRFKAHEDSRKREDQTRENIKEKMKAMFALRPNSAWVEVQWLEQGMNTLFNSRKGLQFSYVFGYYLFDSTANIQNKELDGCRIFEKELKNSAKNVFDDNQEQLENSTEKLSHLLELPVEKFFNEDIKQDIMGTTVLCDSRLQSMFSVIRDDLMVAGEFGCPKPKSMLATKSTQHRGQSALSQLIEAEEEKKKIKEQEKLVLAVETDLQGFDVELQRAIMESMTSK